MAYVLADPQSKLDFAHDWSLYLAPGDTINTHAWSISPAGPTLTGASTDVCFVVGLEFGKVYRLTEHIATSGGVEDDRMIVIRCGPT